MFVLTDIEWVTSTDGHFSPTQLAAIRVDEAWNGMDRFDSFIRPRDSQFHDWKHVAYHGGTAAEFLQARNAYHVLCSFLEWLSGDDILLWWYEESNTVFKKLVNLICRTEFGNRTVVINKYVYSFLAGQAHSRGNAYSIAEARGIATNPDLKHYSVNDVLVMQKLMMKIDYPQAKLLLPPEQPQKKPELSRYAPDLPYQYDPESKMIHLKDCPILKASKSITQGYETWSAPLRKGFKPCSCCKEEYRKAFRERNRDILERTQYTYAYSADSRVFHKYSCGVLLSAKNIYGAKKYSTVIKTGRRPCKLCRPTPEDTYQPVPPKQKKDGQNAAGQFLLHEHRLLSVC